MHHHIPIEAPCPTFFDCLIRGFFWEVGFSYSPVQRDALVDTLKERVGEVEDWLAAEEEIENIDWDKSADDDEEDAEYRARRASLEAMTEKCQSMNLPHPHKI